MIRISPSRKNVCFSPRRFCFTTKERDNIRSYDSDYSGYHSSTLLFYEQGENLFVRFWYFGPTIIPFFHSFGLSPCVLPLTIKFVVLVVVCVLLFSWDKSFPFLYSRAYFPSKNVVLPFFSFSFCRQIIFLQNPVASFIFALHGLKLTDFPSYILHIDTVGLNRGITLCCVASLLNHQTQFWDPSFLSFAPFHSVQFRRFNQTLNWDISLSSSFYRSIALSLSLFLYKDLWVACNLLDIEIRCCLDLQRAGLHLAWIYINIGQKKKW